MLHQEGVQLLAHNPGDDSRDGCCPKHLFGLTLELRFGESDGDDCGQSLQNVVLDDGGIPALEQSDRAQPVVEALDQGPLEPSQVGAALRRSDDVDERTDRAVIAHSPAQGDIHVHLAFDFCGHHVPLAVEDRNGFVEVTQAGQTDHATDGFVWAEHLAELLDAPGVMEGLRHDVRAPLVPDVDREVRYQVRRLLGPAQNLGQVDFRVRQEHLPVGPPTDSGPGARPRGFAGFAQPRPLDEEVIRSVPGVLPRQPAVETHRVRLGVALHPNVQSLRQRVHHRRADAVQSAGGGIRPVTEFPARVQTGHHELNTGQPASGLHVDRDTPAVVGDLDRAVGVQGDVDTRAVAVERLVDGVVDDLPQAVGQPPGVGGTDVHARSLADRFQALQHRQVFGRVVTLGRLATPLLSGLGSHGGSDTMALRAAFWAVAPCVGPSRGYPRLR